ncbi:aspartate/glutamate racemase family protein [Aquibacillus salsiterrae]|uniref:Amino acid racemase n=1 Tax=Aquibacillus salsiterrae TaxID=2950439 RepID=A0A9X4AHU0_9BACI|nr:amino acid racemase [Aquibacillus salsiterrae]MDC3418583.1 amino acid racemase [Aquibacillus salsiterrae]
MAKIGLVGGLGPESTVEYYQSIISGYQEKLGSNKVLPHLVINSINMYQVFAYIDDDNTQGLSDYLTKAVNELEASGVDFAAISANTPHIVFDQVNRQTRLPLISIVEETVKDVRQANLNRVGLIGTRFTMANDFFKKPFRDVGIDVIVPNEKDQVLIHEKTVDELENGIVKEETKETFLEIICRMEEEDGIEGLILGCTEHPMLIKPTDTSIKQFNTTAIHVSALVERLTR